MALVPIRVWLIPRMPFTEEELDCLDGPVASAFVSHHLDILSNADLVDPRVCWREFIVSDDRKHRCYIHIMLYEYWMITVMCTIKMT